MCARLPGDAGEVPQERGGIRYEGAQEGQRHPAQAARAHHDGAPDSPGQRPNGKRNRNDVAAWLFLSKCLVSWRQTPETVREETAFRFVDCIQSRPSLNRRSCSRSNRWFSTFLPGKNSPLPFSTLDYAQASCARQTTVVSDLPYNPFSPWPPLRRCSTRSWWG